MERAIVLTILILGFLSTVMISWGKFTDIAVVQVGAVRHGISLDEVEGHPAEEMEMLVQEPGYEYDGLTSR